MPTIDTHGGQIACEILGDGDPIVTRRKLAFQNSLIRK
jgi:hypothetical protein